MFRYVTFALLFTVALAGCAPRPDYDYSCVYYCKSCEDRATTGTLWNDPDALNGVFDVPNSAACVFLGVKPDSRGNVWVRIAIGGREGYTDPVMVRLFER